MTDKQSIALRVYFVGFVFIAALLCVVFETFSIQMDEYNPEFKTNSKYNKKIPVRISKRTPRMGDILDMNGISMVTSISFFDIYMDPTVPSKEVFDSEITDLCEKLSDLFPEDIDQRDFENKVRNARERDQKYLLVRKKVTNEQRNRIKEFPIFKLGRNKGGLIDFIENSIRKRPFGDLMSRTLGYYKVLKNNEVLRVGIEGAFYEYLKGEEGEEIEQRISTGWKKTGQVIKTSVEGANVVTSIDKEIQEVAHNELYTQLRDQNATSGCAIVMEVKTGFIKAIVNLSQENDESPSGKKSNVKPVFTERYNQAIGSREVPGSTFKLASLMAGLEDDKFKISDEVQGASLYRFNGLTLHEVKGHNYGKMTIQQAFEKSSNVIARIIYRAYRDEPQLFIKRLEQFGLTESLDHDLVGEPNPKFYRPGSNSWHNATLASMAVGYEFQQTPLQTLAFYNAVANHGKFMKPQFVKKITRGQDLVKEFQPIVLKQKICSMQTLEILQKCLKGVMTDGTGKKITSSYFDIAGKTGTAMILNDKSKKSEHVYLASFVGYFPVKNPLYSCIVSVEAVGNNVYGGSMSGKVFSEIANKVYATSLKYHKAINENGVKKHEVPISKNGNSYDLKKALKKLNVPYRSNTHEEWVKTTKGNVVVLDHVVFNKSKVPNVIGMTAKDAVKLIETTGMYVSLRGYGRVVSQTEPAGNPVYKGGLIQLKLE